MKLLGAGEVWCSDVVYFNLTPSVVFVGHLSPPGGDVPVVIRREENSIEETNTVVFTPGPEEKHHVECVHSMLFVGAGLIRLSWDLAVDQRYTPSSLGVELEVVRVFT